MRALVIGGDGFIGSALVQRLAELGHDVGMTTRRIENVGLGRVFLDMRQPILSLPPADVGYVVAAIQTFQGCEGNPEAYRVNVDATSIIIRKMARAGTFPVFVSSDSVEWAGVTAYARHKSLVEMVVHASDGAIVRPSRVRPDRVDSLCDLMIKVGEDRLSGVHVWGG